MCSRLETPVPRWRPWCVRAGSTMVRVKICGNTDAGQVRMAVEAGADCVGIVVEYPVDVPWNVSRAEAAELAGLIPPMVSWAVVTGGDADRVLSIAGDLRPPVLQLHTDNRPDETAAIARELRRMGVRLIKALRVDVATGRAVGEETNPVLAAGTLVESGVDAILLDACTRDLPAGTGVRLDWSLARTVREAVAVPLVLAGGLTPDNVGEAVRMVRPYGVDVITGVERERRQKDPDRVRAFVEQARKLCRED